MKVNTKILVAPLNWGLGHAARCIPIIRELKKQSFEVYIASDGASLKLLKTEFPNLTFFEFPSYNISYNSHFVWSMAKKIPDILRAINEENSAIAQIVTNHKIEVILSDNRYGCFSEKTKNIFVCHQLHLLMPWWLKPISPFINLLHSFYLKKFDELWVPDHPNQKLSGILSSNKLRKLRFIGALSRFSSKVKNVVYDVAAIVSGPEPQRSYFENILWEQFKESSLRTILVCGKVEDETNQTNSGNATKVNFLNSGELESLLNETRIVVCRSGYSSVMDMAKMGKRVVFIPTPGQTEQEYLAERFHEQRIAPFFSQNQFILAKVLETAKNYSGFSKSEESNNLLTEAIKSI